MFINGSKLHVEKGNLKTLPVKPFQNQTSDFREREFLRISSCSHSASNPHSPKPCLLMDKNSANNIQKGSPKEHFCTIISNSDGAVSEMISLRISSCSNSTSSPKAQEACLLTDHFVDNF